MAPLSSSDRRLLKDTAFAVPRARSGTTTEKAMARAEVQRRFPKLGEKGK